MSGNPPAIHQLLAGFMPGDGISNFARELQEIFRGWGRKSEIFVTTEHTDPRVGSLCLPLEKYRETSSPANILIHHFGIGDRAGEYFATVPDHRVMIFHNITPPEYFDILLPETATYLREGKEQLRTLLGRVELILTNSRYNQEELKSYGFDSTGVIHQPINRSSLLEVPDPKVEERWGRRDGDLVFVGRIAPNKRFEDLLLVFSYYKLCVKPKARLFLVGDASTTGQYLEHLRRMIQALSLPDVIFTGHTSHAELLAYYRLARAFLCLSEHEGFCVPLLEAMHFDLPVVARACAAVPETMDGAGVLVEDLDHPEVAELLGLLTQDGPRREKILAGQRRRLERFHNESLEEAMRSHLAPWLAK